MTLIQAWIDSVQLLRPKNLKLFVLVTIKSIIEAYKLLFKYFWWIVPAFIAVALLFSLIGPIALPNYYGPIEAIIDRNRYWFYAHMQEISYVLYSLLFLAVCFITRPSIDKKDCKYLRTQYKRIILYSLILMALGISSLSAWHVFVVLFFLDSRGGPKNFFLSMWYALKMIIFNYPLLAVIGILLHLPFWLINVVYLYQYNYLFVLPIVISNMLAILFLPIGICTYANIYIKKLHDQFDLYVKQPQ
jgi:hypothetical protein